MESHIKKQTDVIESLTKDLEELAVKEKSGHEELTSMQNKETEVSHEKADVEKQLEVVESEKVALRQQLKLAQTRIESLQAALQGEDSGEEEEMTSFLDHHRRAMSVQ